MSDSILGSVKSALGIVADYDAFDDQIIMFCNTVFSTLQQLGVGPAEGFTISDGTTKWKDYITDMKLEMVKSYMYMRVRLMFDPPSSSYALSSMKEQIAEYEWRMTVVTNGST